MAQNPPPILRAPAEKQRSAGSALLTRRRFVGQLALGAAALSFSIRTRAQSVAEPRKLGVALVGLGSYSRGQLGPALKLTRHCRLAGVVTGSPEKGRFWAKDHGFPESSIYNYETMPRLAENKDIDIVYVVTPNSMHAAGVIAAAQAGKHVISEKPFTTSVADAEKAIAACKAAKVKLSIGYRLHFDPIHQEFMRLAGDPAFGPFTRMKGAFGFMLGHKVWRVEKKYSGGGPLMDVGIYVLQQACMAAGGVPPVAVTARAGPTTNPELFSEVEESIAWTMEFPGGAVCEATTSYSENAHCFRAESAAGNWVDFKTNVFMFDGLSAETSRGTLAFPAVNQQARQMDDFALCIREGRESRVPGEMGLRDMKIIEAIYASAAGGRRTPVKA